MTTADKVCKLIIAITLVFLCSAPVHSGLIDKEGMAPWEICALCHGADGMSRMAKFPKLAGQKASYIEQQFNYFRQGLRTNDGGQMQAVVHEVNPNDIEEIAKYFSELDIKLVVDDELDLSVLSDALKLGRKLFEQDRVAGSCASCHIKKDSLAPWLDGQHQQYLVKQMQDYASEQRIQIDGHKAIEVLSGSDIESLALYLSMNIFR